MVAGAMFRSALVEQRQAGEFPRSASVTNGGLIAR